MSERPPTNRRAFFTRAWRVPPAPAPERSAAADPAPATAEPARPGPATGSATLEDVLAHAVTVGLAARAGAIRSLARWSVRLTESAGGTSSLGGAPDLPGDVAWPSADGRPLPFVAQVDLGAVAALGVEAPLPAGGRLLVFAEPEGTPFVRGSVLVVPGPVPGGTASGGRPLEVSPELSLPRVWSAPVQALGLADDERDAWQALRAWLAERQGVELHDRASGFLALHRLLGYPDEKSGDMPLMCELSAAGADLADTAPLMHPLARELEARSGRWRLLLQLSVGERERVYAWVAAEDLDAGDLSRVRLIRR